MRVDPPRVLCLLADLPGSTGCLESDGDGDGDDGDVDEVHAHPTVSRILKS